LPPPVFKKGILKLEDLEAGMELKGTVLNVVDFGAFVDIGLKDSGLVHISQLANRYIKSPHDVVSVGDVVTIWVMGVDQERKRVSLTMVKPGTERPRGAQGQGQGQGGGRRGGGGEPREGQGQGQGRPGGGRGGPGQQGQGGGRPPRREGSALTTPPVGTGTPEEGAAPAPAAPPRQFDRPGGGGGGGGRGGPRPGGGGGGGRGPGGPGGSRGGAPGGASGRFERAQAPRPPIKPAKPAPPPAPLSSEALTGTVPLRTFGQLKQLWQARVEPEKGEGPAENQGQEPAQPGHSPEAPRTGGEGEPTS